jgi:hypothetical protein
MKLLIETALIFFGTLLAAALLALGDPGRLEPSTPHGESAHPAPDTNVALIEWRQVTQPARPAR